ENLAFRHMDSNLNIMSLTLVASSEGVWCFAFGDNSMLLLWNPSIKKSVGISIHNYTLQPDSPKMIFGFGICPVTLEPTILKINYLLYTDGPCKETNQSWKLRGFVQHVHEVVQSNYVCVVPDAYAFRLLPLVLLSFQVMKVLRNNLESMKIPENRLVDGF
ncbi:hypothetical protein Tco_1157800, partial [Tanacetum coccineum]